MTRYDVAIAGAGPSGSTTAFHLARAGARVILLDRADFPREKPCGGGVTARAFARAPVDLTPVVEHTMTRVRFSYKLGGFFDYEYAPHGRPVTLVHMTQRHRLDEFLLKNACDAGAAFHGGSQVRGLELERDGVRVTTDAETIEAGVLVGADGANGVVARSIGLQPVTDPPVALEAHFDYMNGTVPGDWSDVLALELGSMPGGYGWSFPKSDHFNVGCGGFHSEGGHLREHLSALRDHYGLQPLAMNHLRGHHLPTRDEGKPIVRGRAILVGDAAGLVDPMSGEGIYSAFVSGHLAAAKVLRFLDGKDADLYPYEAAIEREIMGDIRAAKVLRDAYHYTPAPCFFMLRRSERLRTMLCQLITGERSYQGYLRSLGPLRAVLTYWAGRGRKAREKALANRA
ncbi:MAG TPA: geranylgeranyl reductase family protein [Dehalococcoidia bacterium]|nr:geranylgeranyl reductase family protein [Dehalococcoidia bacterium]